MLKEVVSRTRVVVAPDHPVTDRYFSNRLFLMLGFGAFLLHPRSKAAEFMYRNDGEVIFYGSRIDLHEYIEIALSASSLSAAIRKKVAEAGLERTKREHLYRHRCITLIQEVERVLAQKDQVKGDS